MTDSEGAPIYGGVSDPAETSGPGLRYVPAIIYSCPRCGSDLDNEGLAGFWCPSCRQPVSGQEVAYFDESQHDD